MDEVVLQVDETDEADEVMDEEVLEDYGVDKVDELAHEVLLQVDEIDKVCEVLNEVVLFINNIDGVDEMVHVDRPHGTRTCIKRKKCSMVNVLIFVHKNVYRIRFQKIKIGPFKGFEKKAFFSLILMRKRL